MNKNVSNRTCFTSGIYGAKYFPRFYNQDNTGVRTQYTNIGLFVDDVDGQEKTLTSKEYEYRK